MKNKGMQHWIVAFLMCGLAGAGIGILTNTVGVFFAPVSEGLGVLRGSFAMHSTLSLLASGLIALWVPSMMKMIPYKLILIVSAAVAAGCTALMGLSWQIWQFNVLGLLRGLGAGCFSGVPVTIIINHWFGKKNGLITSLALSFSGVAGAVCQPILTACIESLGWRAGYFVQAAMIVVMVLPAILIPFSVFPELVGLQPYGYEPKIESGFKCLCHNCIHLL